MATSKVIYLGNLRTQSTHLQSGHQVESDAPVDNQGKGERFSPTDIVANALASCAMTIMGIAANNHSIPFNEVSAEVEKIMAANPRRIDTVNVRFVIGDKLDDKQKAILENAARTCPVAKSLSTDLVQDMSFDYSAD